MAPTASRPRHTEEPDAPTDRAAFSHANINPETGLANDYLNHFNEAIMVLEMLAAMPDWMEHLLAWEPRSYQEHFSASKLKHRDLAIAAYDHADKEARRQLDELATLMNGILVSLRATLEMDQSDAVTSTLATAAAAHLKLLVARASAVINGGGNGDMDSQSAVDALMSR
jgi:hypothetical protein